MQLAFTPEETDFRMAARAWLAENAPKSPRPFAGPEVREYDLAWQRKQFEGGWAGINWPVEYGGLGLTLVQQLIWYEEYAQAGCPDVMTSRSFVGLNHGGPTLILNASEEQKREHLPKILRGEVVWCQGFSEPGAGSDLASVRTRGRIDADHLIVNGQKLWTSFAQDADYQELLVRTDPETTRHGGLTWIICDMRLPGIVVRPLNLMNGAPEVCEVFYEDVRIPLENVVGGVGRGWAVAMSTLAFERGTAMTEKQVQLKRQVASLIELARETPMADGRYAIEHESVALSLADLRAKVTALQAMTYANISRQRDQKMPGVEGSMIKLTLARLSQAISRLAMDIMGPARLDYGYGQRGWVDRYLCSYPSSIGGGTNEIQAEIIAERGLGLPRSR